MRVAIVGAGIAGITAALELDSRHEVHLFEAKRTAGGHAHTVDIHENETTFPVDMGFIVFNDRNYPIFSDLLKTLDVETERSCMGFSVSDRSSGLEYSGESLRALFASPRNLVRRDFWRMLIDFQRFCRAGQEALASDIDGSILSFTQRADLSEPFRRLFLRPMAGAIWSMPTGHIDHFPASTLLRFFDRHGLLSFGDRPNWRTIVGGSRRYVDAALQKLDARIHLGHTVERIHRGSGGVQLTIEGSEAVFDQVILALHSDQALALLDDPSDEEREVLGAIRYRNSDVVLHCDRTLLPRRRRAWTSWNVSVRDSPTEPIAVTYLMNKLQALPTATPWCVSLNQTEIIDPATIRARQRFAHPQFDARAVRAQERWSEISGRRQTHYCGAYWRYGFHEDGAWSGLRVASHSTLQHTRAA